MDVTTAVLSSAPNHTAWSPPPPPAYPSGACHEGLCRNGGTCHQLQMPTGASSFRCDCPLHFSGRFCEKGMTRLQCWAMIICYFHGMCDLTCEKEIHSFLLMYSAIWKQEVLYYLLLCLWNKGNLKVSPPCYATRVPVDTLGEKTSMTLPAHHAYCITAWSIDLNDIE